MEKMKLSQSPTPEQQTACRDFLRAGLANPKPLFVGSITEGFEKLDTEARKAVEHAALFLAYSETFGTLEVYSNGFNLYVRSAFQQHAVAVYRYRVGG